MSEKYLTKIEINLPINVKISQAKILSKIVELFTYTSGIGGCTYSIPSKPPILKGIWYDKERDVAKSDFQDNSLIQKLIGNNIVKENLKKPNYVNFTSSIHNESDLIGNLSTINSINDNEKASVIEIWNKLTDMDDIIWIYGCYDINEAKIEISDIIAQIRHLIETECGESLAWITYSAVCVP